MFHNIGITLNRVGKFKNHIDVYNLNTFICDAQDK